MEGGWMGASVERLGGGGWGAYRRRVVCQDMLRLTGAPQQRLRPQGGCARASHGRLKSNDKLQQPYMPVTAHKHLRCKPCEPCWWRCVQGRCVILSRHRHHDQRVASSSALARSYGPLR